MKISKLGHACLLVEESEARILIDPGAFSKGYEALEKLDGLLITHQHADHITPETLEKVKANNPAIKVYADAGSAKMLGNESIQTVKDGNEFEIAGVKVSVIGTDHAVIHPELPGIENVGYLIASRLFIPGDAFTVPKVPVEILGLPIGAPWSKISEVIDYMVAVKPKVAFPLHDAVLAIPGMHTGMAKGFAEKAGIEVRVIEDGESAEF